MTPGADPGVVQWSVVAAYAAVLVVSTVTPFVALPATAAGCTAISGPTVVVVRPGCYGLTADATDSGASVVDVRADDVRIDGGGHVLDGVDATGSAGVRVVGGHANVTVTDVVVSDWGTAVDVADQVLLGQNWLRSAGS